MKTLMVAILTLLAFVSFSDDPEANSVTVECNWGTLTMTAIADGFPQGPHSADPSGDGKPGQGNDDADQPRKGLGNVVERGNLQATCEFIASQI